MQFTIFLSKDSINDATEYYLSLIESAVAGLGAHTKRAFDLRDVGRKDVIITIEAKYFLMALLKRPFQKKINWFQGVVPEEILLAGGSPAAARKWALAERLTLRFAAFNIFVSDAMQAHYAKKYGYVKPNYLVIPCFNKELVSEAFQVPGKFRHPSFVYAGSMAKWQSIEKTLEIFALIEQNLPQARLTLLTGQQEEARRLVQHYSVKNVEISYCKLEDLDTTLQQYKYGFLFREDHIVNRVATPTKMNTYLSAGIIPLYTDVVDSFERHINLGPYELKFNLSMPPAHIAERILAFERNVTVAGDDIKKIYSRLYEEYYNPDHYRDALKKRISGIKVFPEKQ